MSNINFLFDAQMPPRFAEGMEMIDQENRSGKIIVKVSHIAVLYGDGVSDLDVIRHTKSMNAVLVSEDPDFYTIEANKKLIKQLGIGVVVYRPPKHGIRYWEKMQAFILAWEDIKEKAREVPPPFLIKFDRHGNTSHERL